MTETVVYYIFCAMCLGGALGVLLMPNCVNAAMSMLVSMLGIAGLMLLMEAYFLAFIMITIYAGAVLVLFVFTMMLVGDAGDGESAWRKAGLVAMWLALGMLVAYFAPRVSAFSDGAVRAEGALSLAKNYGEVIFKDFMLCFQIIGALLLAAMIGVIVVAKPKKMGGRPREMV